MTVREFDSYLFSLAKYPPAGVYKHFGCLIGFRWAIWCVRSFIRENLKNE